MGQPLQPKHKFKSNIKLKCEVKKDDLLFCISGGPNSLSLLNMAVKSII